MGINGDKVSAPYIMHGQLWKFSLENGILFCLKTWNFFYHTNIVISNTPNDIIDWLNLTSWS